MVCFGQVENQNAKNIVGIDANNTAAYEQVVKEGYGTPFIYKELANAHYFKNNYEQAKKWYEILFKEEAPDLLLEHRYIQTLKAIKVNAENKVTATEIR